MDISKYLERDVDIIFSCSTEEKAGELLKKLYDLGFKWSDGMSLLNRFCWKKYKSSTCYWIYQSDKTVGYGVYNNKLKIIRYSLDSETVNCENMNFSNILNVLENELFLENKMPVLLLDGKPINKIEISVKDDIYNINLLPKED